MEGLGLAGVVSFLFYKSLLAMAVLFPFALVFASTCRRKDKAEREWVDTDHFCEAIRSLSSALEAGYSIENAVSVARLELTGMYGENDTIVRELGYISRQVQNNISIEQAFTEFADRIKLPDVRSFADVFRTAKRTGGDIIGIIDKTAAVILSKHELRREVRTMIAAKRLETYIMKVMPFGILLYLNLFSPEMCAGIYEDIGGRIFMSIILLIYLFACRMSDKIAAIA